MKEINVRAASSTSAGSPRHIKTVFDKTVTDVAGIFPLYIDGITDHLFFPINDTGVIYRRNSSNTTIWSVRYNDVSGQMNQWGGLRWYDTVNGRLYLTSRTSAGIHWLYYVDIQTGAITQIGNFDASAYTSVQARYWNVDRENIGSGDFKVVVSGMLLTISSTTAIMTSEPLVLDGITSGTGAQVTGIISPNGKYLVKEINGGINLGATQIAVDMIGSQDPLSIPIPNVRWISTTGWVNIWGDNIILGAALTNNVSVYGDRLFDKEDFFKYIDDYLGL